jgi:hypothetical protein
VTSDPTPARVAPREHVCAFGVRLEPFSLPWDLGEGPSCVSVRWASRHTPTPGDPRGWRYEEANAIVVGWGGTRSIASPSNPIRTSGEGRSDPHARSLRRLPALGAAPGASLFAIEPLHGSSVAVNGSAILLLGPQGTGKSSVAAALEPLGFGLLADDTCAIDRQGRLWPGPPILNPRWGDAPQPVIGKYNRRTYARPRAQFRPRPVAPVLTLTRAGEYADDPGSSTADTFRHILGNVRAPDVLSAQTALQLKVAAMLSPLPLRWCATTPGTRIRSVAEAVAGWLSRLS